MRFYSAIKQISSENETWKLEKFSKKNKLDDKNKKHYSIVFQRLYKIIVLQRVNDSELAMYTSVLCDVFNLSYLTYYHDHTNAFRCHASVTFCRAPNDKAI